MIFEEGEFTDEAFEEIKRSLSQDGSYWTKGSSYTAKTGTQNHATEYRCNYSKALGCKCVIRVERPGDQVGVVHIRTRLDHTHKFENDVSKTTSRRTPAARASRTSARARTTGTTASASTRSPRRSRTAPSPSPPSTASTRSARPARPAGPRKRAPARPSPRRTRTRLRARATRPRAAPEFLPIRRT